MGQLKASVVVVTPFQQNCTLLWDDETKRGVVVDPGGDVPLIEQAIEQAGIEIDAIWITHAHIDHVGGATELKRKLGVDIIGPHLADKELCEGIEKQAEMFGLPGRYQNLAPDRWLEEGETVSIGEHDFDVLHCPGHAPGHVVFVNRAANFAHVGDVLFAGSIGRTDLPGGDHETLIASIRDKLLPLGDEVQFICGHGPPSSIGRERQTNPFLT